MSILLAHKFISFVNALQEDENYQQVYDWEDLKKPFIQTIVLILVAEVFHEIVCIVHMRGYIKRHEHQLFKNQNRGRPNYMW